MAAATRPAQLDVLGRKILAILQRDDITSQIAWVSEQDLVYARRSLDYG